MGEWYPGGFANMRQILTPCGETMGCDEYYVKAGGSCWLSSVSSSQIFKRRLDQLSRQMPLLVASCTGGLVPYQARQNADFLDHHHRILSLPKLESGVNGE
jgi:hypothetical protein